MTCAMWALPEWDETAEQARSPKAIARGDAEGGRRPVPLSPRESQIANLITQGLTNKEIARELNISPATVKTRVHAILGKLGVTRRSAVARAMEKNDAVE